MDGGADALVELVQVKRPANFGGGVKARLDQSLWDEIAACTQSSGKGKGVAIDEHGEPTRRKRARIVEDSEGDEPEEDVSKATGDKVTASSMTRLSISRTKSFVSGGPSDARGRPPLPTVQEGIPGKVFSGLRFRTTGTEAHQAVLSRSVVEHGGVSTRLLHEDELAEDEYILVRLQE